MIVTGGKIHLFSKNWIDFTSTHYVINSILAGKHVADSTETLNTGYLVTSADKAPGQEIVALQDTRVQGQEIIICIYFPTTAVVIILMGIKEKLICPMRPRWARQKALLSEMTVMVI
ncbi:MAG: hypothetical protein WKG06_04690 [Segetibacter sp.]